MNILILNWRDIKNPKSGGAELVTFEHAKSWAEKGNHVVWFSSKFPEAKNSEIISGIHIVRKGNIFTVYFYAAFYYLFSGHQFNVVIDEVHGIPFFTPFYVRKLKVAFIHEVAEEIWDSMFSFPFNIIGKLIESLYLWLYKDIFFWTDAQSTIDELVGHGIDRKKITAIPCAIANDVLVSFPQKEKKPTFIFVSRLVKMKGIEDVIRAFQIILAEKKDANLWIVGSGDKQYLRQLKDMVSRFKMQDKVVFFGHVSDRKKLHLMRRSHMLLHASIKEGWGLVVVEAASQFTPSVVYNVSGLRDSVKNNQTGIIVSQNNPLQLAKKALNLLEDNSKYKKLQHGGAAWARSLNWNTITRESLDMIKRYAKA